MLSGCRKCIYCRILEYDKFCIKKWSEVRVFISGNLKSKSCKLNGARDSYSSF